VLNVGFHPAIIGGATLYVDEKPQASLSTTLRRLGFKPEHGDATVTLTNLGPGAAIPSGQSLPLVRVESRQFAALAPTVAQRSRVEVCYCSMLQQCWLKSTGQNYPTEVNTSDRSDLTSIST